MREKPKFGSVSHKLYKNMAPKSSEQGDRAETDSNSIIPPDEVYTNLVGDEVKDFLDKEDTKEDLETLPPLRLNWFMWILGTYYVCTGLYGVYLALTETKWQTLVFVLFLDVVSVLGVMAGAHRLWAHRTYKAKLPLRLFLAFLATMPMQHSISEWVMLHRVHHKYSETDADPHNAKRGFWYSHMFWIVTHKTDNCKRKCAAVDMSDIEADPVTYYQNKFYYILCAIISFGLPVMITMNLWDETLHSALFVAVNLRVMLTDQQIFLINSFAHTWGNKPYDATINPTENLMVTWMTAGEGFHNYHHTFPWDYAASEFGAKYSLTTAFIDAMVWFGLAYDCKTASKSIIEARKRRTGEGSVQKSKDKEYVNANEKFTKGD